VRFLCVGDQHFDAGSGYGREPGDRLADQEAVWEATLGLAVDHKVDAILHAGDAFHFRRPTPAALLAFQRPLQAFVAEHQIPIVAINGNHDVEHGERPSALSLFERELDLHAQPGIWQVPGLWKHPVTVCTLPWTPGVNRLMAARDGGDRDETHDLGAQLLLKTAADLRAQVDGPAVLLLHWSISGASTPTGILTDEFSEVVIPLEGLEELGFDAIVAGHIHKAQVMTVPPTEAGAFVWSASFVSPDVAPIFYTGSPAPVDFSEALTPHGAWLLDVGDGPTSIEFLSIESRPFITLDYDPERDVFNGPHNFNIDRPYEGAVVRVRYEADEEQARRVDHARLTSDLYEAGAHKVWQIEAKVERVSRARVEGVTQDLSPLAAFDLWLAENSMNPAVAAAARVRLAEHLEAVS